MPGYRCINNLTGYCTDPDRQNPCAREPSCENIRGVYVLQVPSSPSCYLDPRNCGFFISWQEECRRALGSATHSVEP